MENLSCINCLAALIHNLCLNSTVLLVKSVYKAAVYVKPINNCMEKYIFALSAS